MRLFCFAVAACAAQAAGIHQMIPARLVFEPAGGQFLARATGYRVVISPQGAAFQISNAGVRLTFLNSRGVSLEGIDRLPGVVNYLQGSDPARWRRRIHTFTQVRGRGLYPGVDILFHGSEDRLEYDFVVAPGADASAIRLRFTGARQMRIDPRGDLVLDTAGGEMRQKKPQIYQEADGRRVAIDGHYSLTDGGEVTIVLPGYDRSHTLVIDPEMVYSVPVGGAGAAQVNAIATDSQGNTYVTGSTFSPDFAATQTLRGQAPGPTLYRADAGGAFAGLVSVPYNIASIAVDPTDSATAYIGTPAGLYKTTDAGAHAALLSGGLPPSPQIDTVIIDPSHPSTVYALVEPSTVNDMAIYKSTDSGSLWTVISSGFAPGIYRLYFWGLYLDPSQPSHLFVESSDGPFRSTDAGATWVGQSLNYSVLAFDPSHPGTVYAGTLDGYVYQSLNGASTWTRQGSPYGVNAGNGGNPITTLAVDPFSTALFAGPYESTDGGHTWTIFATQVGQVIFDPFDPNAIYSNGVKSTDSGKTWAPLGPYLTPLAFAPDGRIYAAGVSSSAVFVTKLDPSGNNVVYSTYIGGSNSSASSIVVDKGGSAYVTGRGYATDFAITPGALQASSSGAFVLKLNPAGDTLAYSAIVADTQTFPSSIAVGPDGSAYVAGGTQGGLPVTPGAYSSEPPQPMFPGPPPFFGPPPIAFDGFLLKLNPKGTQLSYATYANKQQSGGANAVAVDAAGYAYITGTGFVMKFNAGGSGLAYDAPADPWGVTYSGKAIVVDAGGNAYVAGSTDFSQPFVTKLNSSGHAYFNTGNRLLAGEAGGSASGVAVDSTGNIFIAGYTSSQGFPLRNPVQENFSPDGTGFLAELSSSGELLFSTYVGDTRQFQVTGLALDPAGNPVFCGDTIGVTGAPSTGAVVAKYDVSGFSAVRLDSVRNLASQIAVPVSPGELVAVDGAGFGSDALLFFADRPAAMLPGGATPTGIVPYALAGRSYTVAHVESGGQRSNAVLVPVAPAAPGIFTVDGSGTGQALALNQDGTANSQAHPAPPGSTITFFATGAGQTVPPGVDGALHRSVPASIVVSLAVTIGGVQVTGLQSSVGPAPGFPADVLTIHAPVPALSHALPVSTDVQIFEDGAPTRTGVTVWVGH